MSASNLCQNPLGQMLLKQKKPKKGPIKAVLLLLGIFLIFVTFSKDAIILYEKYFINDHHEVLTYLEKIDQYNNESAEIVDSTRLNLYRKDLGEYQTDIKNAKEDLHQIQSKTAALKATKDFSQHKNAFMDVLNQRMIVLSTYEYTKKTYTFQRIKTTVNELNQKKGIEKGALLQAFKKEGIHYRQLGDGSIRYWFKNHSAKSLSRSL
jgi:hypothetical protein